jgi:hypothetical protein
MAATLQEILLAPETRPKVAKDCYALIQQEMADKSGISAAAVKLAYKTASAFAPGHIQHMIDTLIPGMADQLQPFWADFNASGGSEFGDYLAKHGDAASEAMLRVTDARAKASKRAVIYRAYGTVRGGAAKHVQAALPRVGDLVMKYAY